MSYSTTSSTASPLRSPSDEFSDSCTTTSLSNEPTDTDESSPLTQQNRAVMEDLVPPSGLPIELIDRILELCDYSTFLSLAQVNRFFNFYATEVLLTHEVYSWRCRKIWVRHDNMHRAQILSALNIRQFDMHALSHLDYSFYDKEHLCHQIVSMTRFFRNRVISIDKLTLEFYPSTYLTRWTVNEALTCGSKLIILLEAALEKGCRRFELSGKLPDCVNYRPQQIYLPCTLEASCQPRRASFSKWFHSYHSQQPPPPPPPPGLPYILFPKPKIPAASSVWQSRLSFMTDSPSLTELVMDSSLMWTPSLLSHTLNLLRNQSPVLRKLKIYQGFSSEEDYSKIIRYEEFFSTISLPVLESFSYMTKSRSSRQFELLFSFLCRHPDIHAVRFPSILMHSQAEYPALDTNTFLPNLKTLHAHAKTVSWLLQDPNAFFNLERVSVEAKNDGTIKSYDAVDAALVILGSRMGSRCNSLTHLKLKFSVDEDFCLWLLSHITNRRSNPFQHLEGVETLSISMKDVYAQLKAHHLDNLITWASLFPSLTWLILDGYFDDDLFAAIKTERFTNTLEEKCPLLEMCNINWWKWEKREFVVDLLLIESGRTHV